MGTSETYGQALYRIRRARHKTQENVGQAAGYDASAVSRIENGRMQPSVRFVHAADEYLQADGELIALFAQQAVEAPSPPQEAAETPEEVDRLQLLVREIRDLNATGRALIRALKVAGRAAAFGIVATSLAADDLAGPSGNLPAATDVRVARPRLSDEEQESSGSDSRT